MNDAANVFDFKSCMNTFYQILKSAGRFQSDLLTKMSSDVQLTNSFGASFFFFLPWFVHVRLNTGCPTL